MTSPELVPLPGGDPDPVAAHLARSRAAGRGWVNLAPVGDDDDPVTRHRSVPGAIFGSVSGRGPQRPRVTWTPPEPRRRNVRPGAIGIEHPAGARVVPRLADAGWPVPAGWRVAQDHALRGLVVEVPPDDPGGDVAALRWAVAAARVLAPDTAGGDWVAEIHTG
ncbi:MAG TPA: hypothetical protein VK866_01970 [Acidimicrobiales bacterium]|nr:hypothetical protein [Acidimicrobiales bacterium]